MTTTPFYSIGPLTTFADPAAMRAWLASAESGAVLVYASGPSLGAHPAQAEAARWQAAGTAQLFQRRAERRGCFDYCARKSSSSAAIGRTGKSVGQDERSRAQVAAGGSADKSSVGQRRSDLGALCRLLRSRARRGKDCPSLSELARMLDLPRGQRGRRRAHYLLDLAARERGIRIDRSDPARARIVLPTPKGKS